MTIKDSKDKPSTKTTKVVPKKKTDEKPVTVIKQNVSKEISTLKLGKKSYNVDYYIWTLFVGMLVCGFVYYTNTSLTKSLTYDQVRDAARDGVEQYINNEQAKAMQQAQQQGNAGKEENVVAPVVTGDISDNDAVLGSKDAKVTMVEFSDFECPYCSKFYNDAYQQIKKEYVETGKVKVVFRDFPLSFHESAYPAAHAAECVREQGGDEAFYKMHDKFFGETDILKGDLTTTLPKLVTDLGYDKDKFVACMDSNKFKDEIEKDFSDGAELGVTGTPAFFINGKLIVGSQPFDVFKKAIDAELNK